MKQTYYDCRNAKRFQIKKLISRSILSLIVFAVSISQVLSVKAGASHGNKIAAQVAELKKQGVFHNRAELFSITNRSADDKVSDVVAEYTLLKVNNNRVAEILAKKPEYLSLNIPSANGSGNFNVLLYKVNISPNGFNLLTNDGVSHPDNNMVHYRGSIDNDNGSVVSMSVSENEVMGLICNDDGNYVLGKLKNNDAGKYIFYNDRKLIPHINFECASNFEETANRNNLNTVNSTTSTNCVNWYWETDYDVFTDKGSLANVNTYMQGVFNEVATLYANDGISITLQTLYVWTTVDPYTGPSTGDYLNQFGANRTSFTGDLAHLIGYAGGGGIAWLNGLCSSTQYKQAYSGISSSYNTVPTFSWTVECITHEQGHLLGSSHTHACVWNGNNTAIDGCGPAAGYAYEGSCSGAPIPAGGGTIMSYCHLISAGINLSLGFGPQPTAVMLNKVNTSACLTACSGCPLPGQPGTISGSASVCPNSSQTYSVASVTGVTSYTWTLPSGWSGTSTTNSITVTSGNAGGTISVVANNACGAGTARTLAVTVSSTAPARPGIISGNTSVCPNSSQTYSVTAVTGATSYTWTLPAGWSGTSTTNSITVTAGNTGGTISIVSNNSCASSTSRTLAVATSNSGPSQPGTISGNAAVCPNASQTYSVTAVSGATSYTWTLPSGWSGSSTTNSITATAGNSGGTLSVTANNSCGSSSARTLAVSTSSIVPAQPGAISGNSTVCPGASQTYSISTVAAATSYTWTLPAGWSGTSTTNSITVVPGSAGGTISVTAVNTCGSSVPQSRAITISSSAPAKPGIMSGSSSPCSGSSHAYTVNSVSGATSYTWTLPSGWSGSSTSNSITVTAGSAGGTISVTSNNGCGSSTPRVKTVSISNVPSQPGAIGGNTPVCPNTSQNYSVSLVSGATDYTWTLPSGWSGTSDVNLISLTSGNSGGTIYVTANNTCGSSVARSLPVAVNPPANVSLFQVGNYLVASPVTATDNIQWYYQNTHIPGNNDSLVCIGTGNYFCIVSNQYGCLDTSQVLNITTTGINEHTGSGYSIFPNPVNEYISLHGIDADSKTDFRFSLFNVEGKKILETKLNASSSVIDVKHISSGFYFYELHTDAAIIQSGKVVIMRKEE